MQVITFRRPATLCVSLILILIFGLTPLMAQEMTKVSGKMTLAVAKQEAVDIGDVEGHTVALSIFEGTNFSTGAQKFMDGGHVTNISFGDLVKGNGPHQTYTTVTKKDNVLIAKCEGMSRATSSPDGSMIYSFEGKFTWVGGKGSYANIQGKGTYKGQYIAENIYTVEWEGAYFIKK